VPGSAVQGALLIDAGLRRRGLRGQVQVAVRSAEPVPMPVVGPTVSQAVMQILTQRGIDYRPGRQITAAEPGHIRFADDTTETTDLLVYMPPITAPPVIADSPLAADDGWIHADLNTLATGFDGAYAIGDTNQILLANGKPLRRAGVFAHSQADVVADTIIAAIAGKSSPARFDGHGGCSSRPAPAEPPTGPATSTPTPPPT